MRDCRKGVRNGGSQGDQHRRCKMGVEFCTQPIAGRKMAILASRRVGTRLRVDWYPPGKGKPDARSRCSQRRRRGGSSALATERCGWRGRDWMARALRDRGSIGASRVCVGLKCVVNGRDTCAHRCRSSCLRGGDCSFNVALEPVVPPQPCGANPKYACAYAHLGAVPGETADFRRLFRGSDTFRKMHIGVHTCIL